MMMFYLRNKILVNRMSSFKIPLIKFYSAVNNSTRLDFLLEVL